MNDIIAQFQRNKEALYNLLNNESQDVFLWKQAPEKWCLLEIICHLYDEERLDFRFRVQWVLEKPHQIPPPFNPLNWMIEHQYMQQDYETMLHKFVAEREQSLIWLKSLKNVNWDSSFEHPKLGTMTAKLFLTNWLAHDYLHIKQILRLKYDYLKHSSGINLNYAGTWI